jgi:Uroporphyrinogen-III decarboxylase
MSYCDGMAAINLEMPARVPRTEYSLEMHWDLLSEITGKKITQSSGGDEKANAIKALYKAWNFDFLWNVLVSSGEFGNLRTSMGHAVYAAEGADYNSNVFELFDEPEKALRFDPLEVYGTIDIKAQTEKFNQNYRDRVGFYPDAVNMTGIYITCISGLIEIFGWQTLLEAAGIDPQGFGKVTDRYASWIMQYFLALAESEVPVVMIHDDIVWTEGAFIHPDWYRKYVFPNYKKLFAPLIESKKKIIYASDGSFTEFIDDIADCGVNGFVMEPTTDMKYIAEKYGKTHVFIGNADTRILLSGTHEEIRAEVKRCMDIGKSCPGFFMAVGNHIPPNTPLANVLYYNEIYEELSRR